MKMNLLKNKSFVLLWIGNAVSLLGNRFYNIAIMWYIIEKTGSSIALGLSVLCFTVPSVLIMPFVGVLADRNIKKQLLVGSDLLNGCIMIVIAALMFFDGFPLALLYVLMIISSVVSAFFSPTIGATIPLIVGKPHLTKANSFMQVTNQLSNILGPALAGILLALTNMWLLFLINGISYIISAISELFIHVPKIDIGHVKKHFFLQFKEGLSYVIRYKNLLHLIIVGGVIINFFLAPLNVFITILCNQVLKVGSSGMGIVDAAISVGALIGSILILLNVMKDKIKMVIIGLSIEGLALLIAGIFTNSYLAMLFFAAILGLGISFASVGIGTLYQTLVPENKIGRVSSLLSTLSTIIVPIGTMVGSSIINHLSISLVLNISGILVTLSGLSLIITLKNKSENKTESLSY
ncbi:MULTISPECIES: MFS transporter [Heyndrickxia]|uniref:MFS transporter n=1 Tax=Heyndrickxia vini TaxID=1476025 RepID=A0ABX7E4L1_9BACI|nr:MFS transporter [Heyndrickxia vini]QQZ10235.1 MFS transporter [Heyndrickxia vini]